ncbi:MAG TPA: hypothetical protein VJ694_02980 [Patescibacteria group bacterium]|nr:hypothetical protein [Patescibacteria group bacterium]
MISAIFGWFWLIANLAVAWLALTRRLHFFVRSLIVGGALLGAAAGLCNGLVMTVNGWRMPVESGIDWGSAPQLFSDPEDVDSLFCRGYRAFDPPDDPWESHSVHVDVPPSTPPPPPGTPPEETARPYRPRLAFLDDRHPIVMCGETTLFSKGDIMGALGAVLMLPGLGLLLFGFAWRKIRRK